MLAVININRTLVDYIDMNNSEVITINYYKHPKIIQLEQSKKATTRYGQDENIDNKNKNKGQVQASAQLYAHPDFISNKDGRLSNDLSSYIYTPRPQRFNK